MCLTIPPPSESKGRFFYKTNRFKSIRITNRIESIRIANWNALLLATADTCSMHPATYDDTALSVSSKGVVVNFDLGERFTRPRSRQRGSLRPRARRVAVMGVGAGGGQFYEIFDAKSRVWGQFGPENKLIEGQPNEYDYDVMCRNASVLAFHLWPTVFAGTAFHSVPAPLHTWSAVSTHVESLRRSTAHSTDASFTETLPVSPPN